MIRTMRLWIIVLMVVTRVSAQALIEFGGLVNVTVCGTQYVYMRDNADSVVAVTSSTGPVVCGTRLGVYLVGSNVTGVVTVTEGATYTYRTSSGVGIKVRVYWCSNVGSNCKDVGPIPTWSYDGVGGAQVRFGYGRACGTSSKYAFDKFVQVTVGARHACALKQTGSVYCWGSNDACQVGSGVSGLLQLRPQLYPTFYDFVWIRAASAGTMTCGIRRNSDVVCWGAGAVPVGRVDCATFIAGRYGFNMSSRNLPTLPTVGVSAHMATVCDASLCFSTTGTVLATQIQPYTYPGVLAFGTSPVYVVQFANEPVGVFAISGDEFAPAVVLASGGAYFMQTPSGWRPMNAVMPSYLMQDGTCVTGYAPSSYSVGTTVMCDADGCSYLNETANGMAFGWNVRQMAVGGLDTVCVVGAEAGQIYCAGEMGTGVVQYVGNDAYTTAIEGATTEEMIWVQTVGMLVGQNCTINATLKCGQPIAIVCRLNATTTVTTSVVGSGIPTNTTWNGMCVWVDWCVNPTPWALQDNGFKHGRIVGAGAGDLHTCVLVNSGVVYCAGSTIGCGYVLPRGAYDTMTFNPMYVFPEIGAVGRLVVYENTTCVIANTGEGFGCVGSSVWGYSWCSRGQTLVEQMPYGMLAEDVAIGRTGEICYVRLTLVTQASTMRSVYCMWNGYSNGLGLGKANSGFHAILSDNGQPLVVNNGGPLRIVYMANKIVLFDADWMCMLNGSRVCTSMLVNASSLLVSAPTNWESWMESDRWFWHRFYDTGTAVATRASTTRTAICMVYNSGFIGCLNESAVSAIRMYGNGTCVNVWVGPHHVIMQTQNGSFLCMGSNRHGQCGAGSEQGAVLVGRVSVPASAQTGGTTTAMLPEVLQTRLGVSELPGTSWVVVFIVCGLILVIVVLVVWLVMVKFATKPVLQVGTTASDVDEYEEADEQYQPREMGTSVKRRMQFAGALRPEQQQMAVPSYTAVRLPPPSRPR